MAFRGEEAFRGAYPELSGDFKSYSPSCQGRPGARGYPPDDAIDRRKDVPGMQPEENRKGFFWEDRYHATVVDAHHHLIQGMAYVDLNMVRAGVITHPLEWPFSG
jgi:hypothetical protein